MAIVAGYGFQYSGSGPWRSAPIDDWEIEVLPAMPRAKFAGLRSIDGTQCSVWTTPKGTFAQTVTAARPPKGLR